MNASWTRLLTVTSAIAATTVLSICGAAPSYADPNLSDQDQYPANYPATYSEVQTKIIDLDSRTTPIVPYITIDFTDVKMEREFNSIRAVTREMLDLQTLGDDTIRVRDLTNPYTTALSCFSSYYRSTGTQIPTIGSDCPSVIEVKEEVVIAPPRVAPPAPAPVAPRPPVPALW